MVISFTILRVTFRILKCRYAHDKICFALSAHITFFDFIFDKIPDEIVTKCSIISTTLLWKIIYYTITLNYWEKASFLGRSHKIFDYILPKT